MSQSAATIVLLSHSVYPRECIDTAIRAYSVYCHVEQVTETSDHTVVEISPLLDTADLQTRSVDEFLNYLLELSIRVTLATM